MGVDAELSQKIDVNMAHLILNAEERDQVFKDQEKFRNLVAGYRHRREPSTGERRRRGDDEDETSEAVGGLGGEVGTKQWRLDTLSVTDREILAKYAVPHLLDDV